MNETQMNDVLELSKAFYNIGGGAYSPQIQNQNLKDLTFGNGIRISYEEIKKNLQDFLTQEENLQVFSDFMAVYDSIYNKTIDYYKSILAFLPYHKKQKG